MENTNIANSRRRFLRNSAYIAPMIISLGTLEAKANSHCGKSKSSKGMGYCASTFKSKHCAGNCKGFNYYALNKKKHKAKYNHKNMKTHGGHEKDMCTSHTPK